MTLMSANVRGLARARWLVLALAVLVFLSACGTEDPVDDVADDVEDPAEDPATEDPEGEDPEGEDAEDDGEVAEFFASEELTIIFGGTAGGGFETYSRAIGEALAERLGTRVLVEATPGGGGLVAQEQFNQWAGDPTKLLLVLPFQPLAQEFAGEDSGIRDWNALGKIIGEPRALAVGVQTDFESIEDLQAAEGLRFGTTGIGTSFWVDYNVLMGALGLDIDIISGFDGGVGEMQTAIIRGDLDGITGPPSVVRSNLEAGETRLVLTMGGTLADNPDWAGVESASDAVEPGSEGALLLEAHERQIGLGRILFSPADVDDAHIEYLREAVAEVMNSQEIRDVAEEGLFLELLDYQSGEEIEAELQAFIEEAPQAYQDILTTS